MIMLSSGVARVSPEGGSPRQRSFEGGKIPSKSINYFKSPTSRGGGKDVQRGQLPPPPLATPLMLRDVLVSICANMYK